MRIKFLLSILMVHACMAQKNTYFESEGTYITKVEQQTGFKPSSIIIPRNTDFYALGDDAVKDKLFAFYGVVYADEIITAANLDIQSCSGQFLELYADIPDNSSGYKKLKVASVSYLKDIPFNPEKKTVVFLYSYKMKNYIISYIKPVMHKLKDDPDFEYYVLSFDSPNIKP